MSYEVSTANDILNLESVRGSIKSGFLWLANDILQNEPQRWHYEPLYGKKSWQPKDIEGFTEPLDFTAYFARNDCRGELIQADFEIGGKVGVGLKIRSDLAPEVLGNSLDIFTFESFAGIYLSHNHDSCVVREGEEPGITAS